MTKTLRAAVAALTLMAASAASATEFGGTFTFTNLGFNWSENAPIAAGTAYDPFDFIYGGEATVSQPLSDTLTLQTAYSLGSTQRSKLVAMIRYASGIVDVGIGPAFGLFNSLSSPLVAGLSSEIKVTIPGVVFATFRNDSSLGTTLSAVGDNYQQFSDIRLGWYVRNAICSVQVATRKFQIKASSTLETTDAQTDYAFLVDIFKKNQPYNILMNFGYRDVSKTFVDTAASTSTKDSLGAVIMGAQLTLRPARFLDIVAGLEGGVYAFGFDDLSGHGPSMNDFLFNANVGFLVKTDFLSDIRKPAAPKQPSEQAPAQAGSEPPAEGESAPAAPTVPAASASIDSSGGVGAP